MILILIRHGISKANEACLVTGKPDDILSVRGEKQVDRLNSWLKLAGLNLDICFTSHWKRAKQTAYRICPEANWSIDPRLGETNAGEVANWKLSHFISKYPDFYSSPENEYPGGESHIDLNKRVIEWLYYAVGTGYSNLAAVTHSGPISCILQHLMGIKMSLFPAFLPLQASLSVVQVEYEKNVLTGKLKTFSSGPIENLLTTLK